MKRVWLSLGTAVALFGAVVGSASAAGGGPPETSPTWIEFKNWPYPLQNARTLYVQGAPQDNGCVWSETISAVPGFTLLEGRLTGMDTATCLVRLQRGVPPQKAALAELTTGSDGEIVESGSGPALDESDMAQQTVTAAVAKHSVAAFKSFWEDPLGIDVNSVSDQTDWYWNGSCVVSPVYGSWAFGWFTGTSWWKVDSNVQNTYNCTQTNVSSFAHYANDAFCPGSGNRTHVYYDRSTVHGKYNGSATKALRSWASGGCSGFLGKRWIFCVESPVGSGNKCTTYPPL